MRIVCQAQCSPSNTCGQHPHNNVPDRICQGLHASQFLSRATSAKGLHTRPCAGRSSSLHGVARHSSHLTVRLRNSSVHFDSHCYKSEELLLLTEDSFTAEVGSTVSLLQPQKIDCGISVWNAAIWLLLLNTSLLYLDTQ